MTIKLQLHKSSDTFFFLLNKIVVLWSANKPNKQPWAQGIRNINGFAI
jgi:hypothetical protein